MQWIKSHIGFISILFFYLILFLPFLGEVHLFDWDEINFAEAAREMLVTGDWLNVQINFDPFWEKPPLFIWMQALSMKLFGVHEFAARFPNVIIGLVTLFILYFFVFKRYGKQAAVFTLLLYIGSYTPHFYFKSGIIDPLFNLFIFLSIVYLVKCIETKRIVNFLFSGLFLGLAVITKGPVALLLVGVAGLCYQIIYKVNFYTLKSLLVLLLGFLIAPVLYFGVQVMQNGWWFVTEFLIYQVDLFQNPVASHGQPFYYHFVVLLIGCFPLFILAFESMMSKKSVEGDSTAYRWMKVLFWVVLIIFSLVTTKIVHYSSMCYIPLAVVGGVWLSRFTIMSTPTRITFGIISSVWVLVLFLCGLFAFIDLPAILKPYIKDAFVVAQLDSDVTWSFIPMALAFLLLVGCIKLLIGPTKKSIASFLITNTLVITLLMVSFVPQIEHTVQGKWIQQLESYQGIKMAHFTVGFKSYAHIYYTHHENLKSVQKIKKRLLAEESMTESIFSLNQEEKKEFDRKIRDYIIKETNIPVSVSAKVQKFEEMKTRYPDLEKVFEGNGYGVWERSKVSGK
ncbi:MAG: glycosyl transferase [Bacteroidetes bacterium]|nr:MAG: glycosyl transferase [Bacteroidota bacterium]